MIGDRYANTNVMRTAPLAGVQERSRRFVQRCADAPDRTTDVFVKMNPILPVELVANLTYRWVSSQPYWSTLLVY